MGTTKSHETNNKNCLLNKRGVRGMSPDKIFISSLTRCMNTFGGEFYNCSQNYTSVAINVNCKINVSLHIIHSSAFVINLCLHRL